MNNITTRPFALRYLLSGLCLLLLCLTGCAGGGGGTDAQGFGTEGTGYKSFEIPIVGSLKDESGSAISGARIRTEDAETTTDALGVFGLVTRATEGVSVQIAVERDALKDTVLLDPIAQPTDPTATLSVDLEVDAELQVTIQRQELVTGTRSDRAAARTEESLNDLITETSQDVAGDSSPSNYSHDPDFVDLIPEE